MLGKLNKHEAALGATTDTMGLARMAMLGLVPLSPTLDVAGALASNGLDLAKAAACILGLSLWPAPQTAGWQGLRVGLLPQTTDVEMAPAVLEAWRQVAMPKASMTSSSTCQRIFWRPSRSAHWDGP